MWEATAHALAGLCASLVLVVSPERIVLSGGVMNRTLLYGKVCRRAARQHVCLCTCEALLPSVRLLWPPQLLPPLKSVGR